MGIFTKIKLAAAGMIAAVVALLGILYSREKKKNSELQEDKRVLEKNLEVKDEVHKDELAVKDFEVAIEKNEKKISDKSIEKKKSTDSAIDNTPDGEEYKIDL